MHSEESQFERCFLSSFLGFSILSPVQLIISLPDLCIPRMVQAAFDPVRPIKGGIVIYFCHARRFPMISLAFNIEIDYNA